MSKDFLLYDILGTFMENVPMLALSVFVGYKLTQLVFRKKKFSKKKIWLISIPVIIAVFLLLKSQVASS